MAPGLAAGYFAVRSGPEIRQLAPRVVDRPIIGTLTSLSVTCGILRFVTVDNVSEFDASTFASAVQMWNQGQQEPAKDQVQPAASAGHPMASALLAWFLHQQGEPGWRAAIPYVRTAMDGGIPQAAGFVVANMLTQPDLRPEALALAQRAAPYGLNYVDPFNQAIAFAQQNDIAGISAMLATPWPAWPIDADQWRAQVAAASSATAEIGRAKLAAESAASEVTAAAGSFSQHLDSTRTSIESQSGRLKTLITQTTNAQASSFFDSEATTAEGQANKSWNVGLSIVSIAAVLSLMPVVSHYGELWFGHGILLGQAQLVGAHVTSAVTLAAVAGVLLARSRVRDRNRQRNRDLSVALNTMFAYGEQIDDPAERQRFIHDMGRSVIEAYLRQESSSVEDGGKSLLAALAAR